MPVDTISVGQKYTLNNIYYRTNSADLDPRSTIVIDEFVEFLKANPKIKIEINGHTDTQGDDKSNLALSNDRAFTVFDMLLTKGIDKKRLFAFKGFGASQPIADNSTEAGRAINRRTEFVIVEK
jgi:outer membrane protein OmpA-like peptidoglycan-associated protein